MNLLESVSLRDCNTFGFDVQARYFVAAQSAEEVVEALRFAQAQALEVVVLGGGSNVLLGRNIDGLVLKLAMQGRTVTETADHYRIRVAAGENWHQLVADCVAKDYYGIENMAMIPGTVGAAPIQNIGAYGVELAAVFHELEAIDRDSLQPVRFDHAACQFSYRSSVFKTTLKDRFIITAVTLKLAKKPQYVLSNAALQRELALSPEQPVTARRIFDCVCAVRSRLLPDPATLGNAGSFFMNPIVDQEVYAAIHSRYPGMPAFPAPAGKMKLAAGWLIDQCGFKGYRIQDAGVYPANALVLINHGQATASDMLALAAHIQKTVREKFNVNLEPEPRVY